MPRNGLPAWFDANRVQGHTRLGLSRYGDTPQFANAGAAFAALGAGAFTRHVKSRDDDPWWPSEEPVGPFDSDNLVKDFIDEAHAAGLKIVAYYWHMSEATFANLRPEWVCKKRDGVTPISGPRRSGLLLDITGPYGEVVLTRLRELAIMGADGFFFDFRHLPPRGCWETALAQDWEARTGERPPRPEDANPDYRAFLDFKAQRIEETFIHWRDVVKAEHPDVVFIVSTTTIPALTDREMTTRLARVADSAKNEYLHAVNPNFNKKVFDDPTLNRPATHVRQALGWTVLRDASGGRPPHIWAAGVPNDEHARAFAASLITFGCVANMDVHEVTLGGSEDTPAGKTPRAALEAAFKLGCDASPHLAGTEPVRWAAVHFSERIRNERGADYSAAWREVLWPLVGTFQVLAEDGLPVGVVNDHQLEEDELEGYRLLVLPNEDELTEGEQRVVTRFQRRGGAVIANEAAWQWSDRDGNAAAAAAFREAIAPHVAGAPLQVAGVGGRTRRYAVAYRDHDRLVVAVTNDFSWVQIAWTEGAENAAAPPADGVRVMWRKGHGLPERPPPWPPFRRLQAIEAINNEKTLEIVEIDGGYRVDLPRFPCMALVVVSLTRRPRLGAPRLAALLPRLTRTRGSAKDGRAG
jgi:hypothetical protein